MSKPWMKSWANKIDNPKVMTLTAEQYRVWDVLLCIALRHDRGGALPPLNQCAYILRADEQGLHAHVDALIAAELIDDTDAGLAMHDWDEWQDYSAREEQKKAQTKDRVQRYRDRLREATGSASGYTKHRDQVYERDGHACVYCGGAETLCLDHLVPGARGGDHAIDNLVTACKACSSGKSGRLPEEAGYVFVHPETAAQYAMVRERLAVSVTPLVTVTPLPVTPVTAVTAVIPKTRQEERREEETKPEKTQSAPAASEVPAIVVRDFNAFMRAYPAAHRGFVNEAKREWLAVHEAGDLPEILVILRALNEQKESTQWTKDGGKFAPNMGKYIQARMWEAPPVNDDPKPKRILSQTELNAPAPGRLVI